MYTSRMFTSIPHSQTILSLSLYLSFPREVGVTTTPAFASNFGLFPIIYLVLCAEAGSRELHKPPPPTHFIKLANKAKCACLLGCYPWNGTKRCTLSGARDLIYVLKRKKREASRKFWGTYGWGGGGAEELVEDFFPEALRR